MLEVAESETMLAKARAKLPRGDMRREVSGWPWALAEEWLVGSGIYAGEGCWLSCEERERMAFERLSRRL